MRRGIGIWGQIVWAWTLGGLPGWFVLPGFLQHWSQPLYVDGWPIKAADLRRGGVFDFFLGPDLLLEKRITLPVAARGNLSKVIDLNMRQTLPGGGADLLWRFGIGERDGVNLDIPIYLLKKTTLAEIKATASSQGAKVRSIRVASDTSAQPFWDDCKRMERPRRFWGIVTASLMIALVGMFVWGEAKEIRSLQSQVSLLEERKTDLSSQAIKLRAKLDVENTSFAVISRDLEMFKAEYHRLPILLELTEALNDETWISELEINGSNLQLAGFTGRDVTEVMARIRELPWALRVDLNGPVSFDSFSRRNRFGFSIKLHPVSGEQP